MTMTYKVFFLEYKFLMYTYFLRSKTYYNYDIQTTHYYSHSIFLKFYILHFYTHHLFVYVKYLFICEYKKHLYFKKSMSIAYILINIYFDTLSYFKLCILHIDSVLQN